MRRLIVPGIAAALLLGSVTAANAITIAGPSISDASFEDPALPSMTYVYFPTATGANFSAGPGGAGVQSNGSGFQFAPAPDGVQTAFIQTGGAITLDVSGLTVGRSYDFSFYIADRVGYAVNPIQVSYADVSDPVFGVYTPTGTAFEKVTTGPFTANATTGTLEFASTTTGVTDTDIGLDEVSISAVPELSTWALMIAGLGCLGLALRGANASSIADRRRAAPVS